MKYFSHPPESKILWFLFFSTLAIMVGLLVWGKTTGGTVLDFIASVSGVQARLQQMEPEQKYSHFFMTLILDTLFPLVYGSFMAGLTLKASSANKDTNISGLPFPQWLAIPAYLAIPVDLTENVTQLLALVGYQALLPIKTILTPLKFILTLAIAAPIAVMALILLGYQKYRESQQQAG